jgi:protein SCO1/2
MRRLMVGWTKFWSALTGREKFFGSSAEGVALGYDGSGLRPASVVAVGRDFCRILLPCLLFAVSSFGARAQSLTDDQLSDVRFDQNLGEQISLDLQFRDENGRVVALGDCFGRKPVVLVLGYYQCPMLCTLTFNGMVESLNEMKWSIGNEFNVVHVSIDPNETAALASSMKQRCLKRYGRRGASDGWHFLTGNEPEIRKLANEIGFHYAYDSAVQQYAHPSGLVVVTPDGKPAKYFFGVTFSANDLYAALSAASERKVGSAIQRLVLLCFHYNPIRGKHGALIMSIVRLLSVATIVGMTWFAVAMARAEKRNRRNAVQLPRVEQGSVDSISNPSHNA